MLLIRLIMKDQGWPAYVQVKRVRWLPPAMDVECFTTTLQHMRQRKLELPEELKFENRLKWGYESPDESPKQVHLNQYGEKQPKLVEVYNFYDYSFSEN